MKKVVSILISISLILMSVPAFAISGSGTEANPYLISSASDILRIHNDLDGYYKLTADINMQGIEYEPVGNEYEGAFTGTIDGNGHTISNLNINLPENKYVGLVGFLEGTVKNLNLNNVNACGYNYIGGIAGYAEEGSKIYNCSVTGTISDIYKILRPYVGGITGHNNGTITDCSNRGFVHDNSGLDIVGGIAGSNSGIITDCVNSGEISNSKHSAGGITGYNSGTITDCSNSGDISDGWPAGAIVASNNNGKVSNCISVSLVKGNETHYVSNKIITLSAATLHCGTRCTMPIELYEYDRDRLTWVSSNNSVATVDQNGVVTGVMVGTATITATTTKGISTSATVTVTAPVSTGITLNNESVSLQKGYTYRLIATLTPSDSQDAITWSTSNSNYVSVSSDGIITANRVGAATITATSTSGKKAYCVVNVTEPTISVSSVTLNKTELVLTQADMAQLTAEVLPSNATNKDIVWTSSDEAVATVSNTGVVTATGVGTAIIKATANNGMYHECGVKVISASGSSFSARF